MRYTIPNLLRLSVLLFIIPCAWPGVAKAQEGLRLQLFDWQDQLPVSSRPELDGRIVPHVLDSRRDIDWDDTVYGFEMSLGSGWQSGDASKKEGFITVVPRATGFLLLNPWDHVFVEGQSELDWHLAAERDGNEYANGEHRWDALLTWGEEHGFDWLISYDATHGNNRDRLLNQAEVGPAPFLQHHVTTSLRPRFSFSDDLGFGIGADYGYREWLYGGDTPVTGVSEHEVSGTIWQCVGKGDIFGANRCVTLLRVAYTNGTIGHQNRDGEKVCQNGKCGFAGPQPGQRPDQIEHYEEFAMKVGFVDGIDFGDIKAVLSLEPSWIWDADRCSFFADGDPTCKEPDDWRRGGWMFNAEIGYTHAIEEWTWGIFFRSETDPSPDGRMLGTARRFEIAFGRTDSEREGFGFNTELAVEMWEEIFCGSCRTSWLNDNEGEDEDSVPSNSSYEDNSTVWLGAFTDFFWDFNPNLRAGVTWQSSYGNQLDPRTWAIVDDQRSWAHEGRAYLTWRPAFSETREDPRDFGGSRGGGKGW